MIVTLRSAKEMELEKSGHPVEMAIARQPHAFERALSALHDLEAIHGDIHGDFLLSRGDAEPPSPTFTAAGSRSECEPEAAAREKQKALRRKSHTFDRRLMLARGLVEG